MSLKYKTFTVRISPPLRDWLEKVSERETDRRFKFHGVADVIREALVEYKEKYEQKNGKL